MSTTKSFAEAEKEGSAAAVPHPIAAPKAEAKAQPQGKKQLPKLATAKVSTKPMESGKLYDVFDSSATSNYPVREHEITINGDVKKIKFKYAEPTRMAFAEAMKFQKDGFLIKDEDGVIIQRPVENTLEDMSKFGPDKVIASLEELREDALYIRAASLSGGEKFSTTTPAKILIKFLLAQAEEKLSQNTRKEEGPDDLSAADLDAMGLQDAAE